MSKILKIVNTTIHIEEIKDVVKEGKNSPSTLNKHGKSLNVASACAEMQ